jgi:hypothetical protein
MPAPVMPSGPIDIQAQLDKWLEGNPEAQKYVTKLWYVPEGQQAPTECTHKIRLNSVSAQERALSVGVVATKEFALFLDMVLSMIATNPTG